MWEIECPRRNICVLPSSTQQRCPCIEALEKIARGLLYPRDKNRHAKSDLFAICWMTASLFSLMWSFCKNRDSKCHTLISFNKPRWNDDWLRQSSNSHVPAFHLLNFKSLNIFLELYLYFTIISDFTTVTAKVSWFCPQKKKALGVRVWSLITVSFY